MTVPYYFGRFFLSDGWDNHPYNFIILSDGWDNHPYNLFYFLRRFSFGRLGQPSIRWFYFISSRVIFPKRPFLFCSDGWGNHPYIFIIISDGWDNHPYDDLIPYLVESYPVGSYLRDDLSYFGRLGQPSLQ